MSIVSKDPFEGIIPYDPIDFEAFKFSFRVALTHDNLHKILDGLELCPNREHLTDSSYHSALADFVERNTTIYRALTKSINLTSSSNPTLHKAALDIIRSIPNLDGKAAWDAIVAHHEAPIHQIKLNAIADFLNIKMRSSESVSEYRTRSLKIFDQLLVSKISIEDIQTKLFVDGLASPKYDKLKQNLYKVQDLSFEKAWRDAKSLDNSSKHQGLPEISTSSTPAVVQPELTILSLPQKSHSEIGSRQISCLGDSYSGVRIMQPPGGSSSIQLGGDVDDEWPVMRPSTRQKSRAPTAENPSVNQSHNRKNQAQHFQPNGQRESLFEPLIIEKPISYHDSLSRSDNDSVEGGGTERVGTRGGPNRPISRQDYAAQLRQQIDAKRGLDRLNETDVDIKAVRGIAAPSRRKLHSPNASVSDMGDSVDFVGQRPYTALASMGGNGGHSSLHSSGRTCTRIMAPPGGNSTFSLG